MLNWYHKRCCLYLFSLELSDSSSFGGVFPYCILLHVDSASQSLDIVLVSINQLFAVESKKCWEYELLLTHLCWWRMLEWQVSIGHQHSGDNILPFVFETLQMFPKCLSLGLQFINVQVINIEWLTAFSKNLLLTVTFGTTTLLAFLKCELSSHSWILVMSGVDLAQVDGRGILPVFGPCLTLRAARAAFFLSASSARLASSWAIFFSFSIRATSRRAFSA